MNDGQNVLDDILLRALNDNLISEELILSANKMKKYIENVNAALADERKNYEDFLNGIKENDKRIYRLV